MTSEPVARIDSALLMFRSRARACALQMLFQWDMTRQAPGEIEKGFWKTARGERDVRLFANQLFENAVARVENSDSLIAKFCRNWRLERISPIDRSILRLAVAEFASSDSPAKVILDEALELTKKFSAPESLAFLNGVLDAILKSLTMN